MGYRQRRNSYGRRNPYRGNTRRGGSRTKKGRTLRRVGIGLGLATGALLAVNAGILGAAGTSRAVKELAGTARTIGKWAKSRRTKRAALKATTVAFHARRVARLKIRRPKRVKIRRLVKR